jgi:DNA-binding LacI/PurR family transcriptional regulator
MTAEQYDDFSARFHAIRGLELFPEGPELAAVRADLAFVAKAAHATISQEAYAELRQNTIGQVGRRLLRMYMQPQFERALSDKRITAWIGANDTTGLAALEYLRARGIELPRQLSLVSFENLPTAFEARLTTFDFDLHRIVREMLLFVTEPPKGTKPKRVVPIEVEGVIMDRETLGRCRTSDG